MTWYDMYVPLFLFVGYWSLVALVMTTGMHFLLLKLLGRD